MGAPLKALMARLNRPRQSILKSRERVVRMARALRPDMTERKRRGLTAYSAWNRQTKSVIADVVLVEGAAARMARRKSYSVHTMIG
jgi:hypothetical protein